MTKFGVGLDLGSANSVAATALEQNNRLITPVINIERDVDINDRGRFIRCRKALLPSYVGYIANSDHEVNIGDFAKKLAITKPADVACSIKNQLGQTELRYCKHEQPWQAASRILEKMRMELSAQIGTNIDGAVFTIPAGFTQSQRDAWLQAAEHAGFLVRLADGTFRHELLLPEYAAAIYDLLNQIQNGFVCYELANHGNIIVYDIGGETLDVTFLHLSQNEDGLLDFLPIASASSNIAGDAFDQILGQRMYENYLGELEEEDPEEAEAVHNNEDMAKRRMLLYAEELKINLANFYQRHEDMGLPLYADECLDYGGDMPNALCSCEGYLELQEIEEILEPLLGSELSYDDYKNLSNVDHHNIIYPILEVLAKAAENTPDVKVDAVILTGGMGRLYLIEKRLESFFGFSTLKTNDPDQAVARGGAVYHYNMLYGNF